MSTPFKCTWKWNSLDNSYIINNTFYVRKSWNTAAAFIILLSILQYSFNTRPQVLDSEGQVQILSFPMGERKVSSTDDCSFKMENMQTRQCSSTAYLDGTVQTNFKKMAYRSHKSFFIKPNTFHMHMSENAQRNAVPCTMRQYYMISWNNMFSKISLASSIFFPKRHFPRI